MATNDSSSRTLPIPSAVRFNPLDLTNDNKSVMAFNLSYLFEEKQLLIDAMGRLLKLVEEGKIHPPSTRAFDLEKVPDAHRAIESGTTTGKLVLTTAPSSRSGK